MLAQRRQILLLPVKPDEILPIQPILPGEKTRTLVGDATTIGRPSKLYEVRVDYNGRNERFYEWVDMETGIVLKLVSQDRDWSIEYQRIRFSPQPDHYFDEPTGYTALGSGDLSYKKKGNALGATPLRNVMHLKIGSSRAWESSGWIAADIISWLLRVSLALCRIGAFDEGGSRRIRQEAV